MYFFFKCQKSPKCCSKNDFITKKRRKKNLVQNPQVSCHVFLSAFTWNHPTIRVIMAITTNKVIRAIR